VLRLQLPPCGSSQLFRIFDTWTLAVLREMKSTLAICLFESPLTSRSSTWFSRAASPYWKATRLVRHLRLIVGEADPRSLGDGVHGDSERLGAEALGDKESSSQPFLGELPLTPGHEVLDRAHECPCRDVWISRLLPCCQRHLSRSRAVGEGAVAAA